MNLFMPMFAAKSGGLTLGSTGFTNAGTIAQLARGGALPFAWSNPTNAQTANNAYATYTTAGVGNTPYLRFSNFGLSVPPSALILGIEVQIQRHGGTIYTDSVVSLVNSSGVIVGTNKATAAPWGTTDPGTYVVYGGTTDIWNLTLFEGDVESTAFGFVLSVRGTNFGTISVDHAQLNVHYGT